MDSQLDALEQARTTLIDMAIKFGPRVVVAILIMVAGVVVGRWVAKGFSRSISKFGLEPPLQLLIMQLHCCHFTIQSEQTQESALVYLKQRFKRDLPLHECAKLGAIAAAEVISHVGPRPLVELKSLLS